MSKSTSMLASGLAVAVIAAGIAAAQGIPGLAQPTPPPATGAPVQINVEMLNNAAKGYQIGYPAGWQVIAGSDAVDYAFLSPDQNAVCIVVSIVSPDLANVSNEVLKQAMSVPQGEEFWTQNFFNQVQNVKYQHVGATTQAPGGWPLQTVIATADIASEGATTNFAFAGIFTVKSSTIFRSICYVPTTMYEQTKPLFFAVFDSFKITK